ncbi:MAG: MBL fold metallo-hydrolase [Lachnospiraceae bacterium]|jgi:competence protein ComEC|nr:MBL fold metallo-hydrolase [Lachnospiraceae bacterium]
MKKEKICKRYSIMILASILLLCGCGKKAGVNEEKEALKITFFDVGKGDAILIETKNTSMLIDAGYDETCGELLDYLGQQDRQPLDYLVITHFDKDHVGGADRVLEGAGAEQIFQPDYEGDGGQYLEYQEALEAAGQRPDLVTDTTLLSFDGVECLIYPPQKQEYEEEDNDFSLVISMTYEEQRFLFAGDCEKERLKELLSQTEFDLKHDLLKVPHHGRKEKNSEEFFEAVSPEIAVITCSEEEPGDDKVRKILRQTGAQTYLTSDGTLTCLCDGTNMEIWQE